MADSIAIIVIAFGILSFGLFYGVCTYTVDMPISIVNDQIDSGLLSADTIENFNLMLNLWKTLPIIFVLGLIIWCYERAKGGDVTATLFFEYESLLVIGVLMSVYMVYTYGLTADLIFNEIYRSEALMSVSSQWDSLEMRALLMKMYYIVLLIPGFLSSLLYLIHPILRQKDNTYSFFGSGDEDGSGNVGNQKEYVTPYEPAQFQ
ncbi:hypothetical protein EQO05_00960 [Methanosarcina sp. MSH10X1]|uniref:hypothetical protein n=1 Tax=Methanosarcina sp. MSH10X1 TaxID=2507075 RepID=UPI000FFC4E94|nr:hypothetical protein [Methanosarcina sp. MSH10X1]RXA21838.1 hypothetical protein EQO05_00960 [Methanosarcina sp. MSH10X1]